MISNDNRDMLLMMTDRLKDLKQEICANVIIKEMYLVIKTKRNNIAFYEALQIAWRAFKQAGETRFMKGLEEIYQESFHNPPKFDQDQYDGYGT